MSDEVEWQRVEYDGGDLSPRGRLHDFTQLILDMLDAEAVASSSQQRALACYLLGARDAAEQQRGEWDFGERVSGVDTVAEWLGLAEGDAGALWMFCSCVPHPPAPAGSEAVDRTCRGMPERAEDIRAYWAQVEAFWREPAGDRAYWKKCWGAGFEEFLDWLAAPDGFEPQRVNGVVAGTEGA